MVNALQLQEWLRVNEAVRVELEIEVNQPILSLLDKRHSSGTVIRLNTGRPALPAITGDSV